MAYVLICLIGYLLGCSNLAAYLAKWKHVDLKSRGSGNHGASNTTIVLGWRAGVATALHDIGKAALAEALARGCFQGLPMVRKRRAWPACWGMCSRCF